jgi:hypothetical protein
MSLPIVSYNKYLNLTDGSKQKFNGYLYRIYLLESTINKSELEQTQILFKDKKDSNINRGL